MEESLKQMTSISIRLKNKIAGDKAQSIKKKNTQQKK